MERSDHYVFLSSNGNWEIFPHNQNHSFENKLFPSLHLDPAREHEVGLINIVYPSKQYALIKDNPDSGITFYGIKPNDNTEHEFFTYTPRTDLFHDDVKFAIRVLNREIANDLKRGMGSNYSKYFDDRGLFEYSPRFDRVILHFQEGICNPQDIYCTIKLKLGSRLARFLGFERGESLTVYKPYDLRVLAAARINPSPSDGGGEGVPPGRAGALAGRDAGAPLAAAATGRGGGARRRGNTRRGGTPYTKKPHLPGKRA